ncbi:Hsp70 family protein [Treponema sp.]|uniref:Hsp70 family protein n=1 Tax=Treponema sp. TaxID=166 RepID=UPI00298D90D1|nr:Hsp70 family protein [Treponema sp.]MCQ2241568.1 Hsp70 family protein [Treponema sp.]
MAIIGIDLGTTNSLVSVWRDFGPVIIPNALGKNLTPSFVSIKENNTIVTGQAAKEMLITDPENTAYAFKRTMGQRYFYSLRGRDYSSIELSAFILSSLKRDAEKFLGEEVTEAVISVPAYFNQNQRRATQEAGKLAGLKVERLISEPTAAALCYGINEQPDMKNAIVLDLGGGTFDVSVLEFFEGIIDVKSVSGDNRLGGEDFTKSISAWFLYENKIVADLTPTEIAEMNKVAETAKFKVSDKENPQAAELSITIGGKEYKSILTPETFSAITSDLVMRLKSPIKKAMNDAGLHVADIDSVILMGGATRMKCIADFAEAIFGDKVISRINPDETVALGAGVLAAMKDCHHELKETVLTDICPFTLSTSVLKSLTNFNSNANDQLICDPIIERNTPVPVSIVKRYFTAVPGQKNIRIDIYQGESMDPDENLSLGCLDSVVPYNKSGHEAVDVRFTYDINGLLEVEVTSVSNGYTKSMVINQGNADLSDIEIAEARKKMENLKVLPWEDEQNIAILEKAKRLYQESIGEQRKKILNYISIFEAALAKQLPEQIKEIREQLERIFDDYDSEIW